MVASYYISNYVLKHYFQLLYFKLFPQMDQWQKVISSYFPKHDPCPREKSHAWCRSAPQLSRSSQWTESSLSSSWRRKSKFLKTNNAFYCWFFLFYFFIALRTMLDRTGCRLPCEHISLLPFILKDHVSIRLKRLCLLPFHHKQYFLR